MGIRFSCPNGHKLNVKEFQAGRKGICPFCGAKFLIPTQSTRASTRDELRQGAGGAAVMQAAAPAATSNRSTAVAPAPREAAEKPADDARSPVANAPFASPSAPSGPADLGVVLGTAKRQPVSAADPITAAGDVVWYVQPPSGGQFGPATGDILRSWLREGRISADTLVWREGWNDWLEAGTVFPQLPGSASVISTPAVMLSAGPATSVAAPTATAKRKMSRNRQQLILGGMIALVILLTMIFLLVLFKPGSNSPEETKTSRRVNAAAAPVAVEMILTR